MRKSICSLNSRSEGFLQHQSYLNSHEDSSSLDLVFQMLSMLTDLQREVVRLYLLDGFTAEEIAVELGISKEVVYCRIHNARKKLLQNADFFFR